MIDVTKSYTPPHIVTLFIMIALELTSQNFDPLKSSQFLLQRT